MGDEWIDDVDGVSLSCAGKRQWVMVWTCGFKAYVRGARKTAIRAKKGQKSAHACWGIVEFSWYFSFIYTRIKIRFGDIYTHEVFDIHTNMAIHSFFEKYFTGQNEVDLSRGKAQPSGTLKGDFVLKKDFFIELPDIDKRFAENVKNIARALVVVNKGDEKVVRENSVALYDMLHGQKELIDVETHSHDLQGHEKQITEKVIHWLNQ